MARRIRLLVAALLACVPLALPGAAIAAPTCADAAVVPDGANADVLREATLCLLNVERTTRGLKPLRSHSQLGKAARAHSANMVGAGFFDHVCPRGSTVNSRVRGGTSYLRGPIRRWALSENIGWGTGELATPQQMVRMWMDSSEHRRNILRRRFRHVGIGVVMGAPEDVEGEPAATYTTDFGFRVTR